MNVLRVRDLMTTKVEVVGPHDDVDLADMIMRVLRFRHLPVVDENGRLVGLLSQRDVLRAQSSSVLGLSREQTRIENMRVRVDAIMTPEVWTLSPEAPALEAAQMLSRYKIGCVPVVEDGEVIGIVTDADFLEFVIRELSVSV